MDMKFLIYGLLNKRNCKRTLKEDIIPNQISQKLNELLILINQEDEKELEEFIHKEKEKEKENSFIFQTRFNFKLHSSIIKEKEHIQKLKEWINDDEFFYKMKRGFSAKRDGFDCQKWHDEVDDKGKTLIVIKTEDNFVFGGFTQIGLSWGVYGYIQDPNAFLFSLRNNHNDRLPEKFPIKPRKAKDALLNHSLNGPNFLIY
ncbi:hypothetical protein M0811_10002 [Anaeramoeba ignava]|uniref:TLDc domain-containing protein n=1 Tax=Anaeramoeba ignava TaxID=1746090 RepID=A0A9Q0LFE6_ANAIG|nr:hypothetical protein M0811_10002 [Anaeramoeba ignava]